MKPFQFKSELERLTTKPVFFSNEGYVINYASFEKDLVAKELKKMLAEGFNAIIKGRKFKEIHIYLLKSLKSTI